MAAKSQVKSLLTKAKCLRQTDEIWEFASPLGRFWITPKRGAAYRPYLFLVVSTAGQALFSKNQQQCPDADQMLETLLRTMIRPGLMAGRPRRPQVVYLDDAEMISALAPTLAELEIRCEHRASLPTLGRTRQFLERGFTDRDPIPGLLSVTGVTPPLVQHLYELAAEYYKAAPWQWLGDHDPMVIAYPPKSDPRYGIVMGSGGEIFGLSVYDHVEGLRLTFRQDLPQWELMQRASWLVLFFEEPMAMSFDDLDAILQYDWPVVNEQAYPVFGRTTPDGELKPPSLKDLLWLEGALSGILGYLPQFLQEGFGDDDPDHLMLPVKTISGKAKMQLGMPELDDLLFADD
ncbi:MAG: hypothetical protein EA342_17675 [Leptolyngbya sp. LCM1.Bin17]|nr:MAG: hypothetical protein EA342_17675 [Leptolyngbya sp. LCM1.Bin17]